MQLAGDELAELRLIADDRRALDARLRELGVNKIGHRMALIGQLQRLADDDVRLEENVAPDEFQLEDQPEPNAPPRSDAPPLRLAIVCHSGYFAGGSFGGGTLASLALLREARRLCECGGAGGGVDVLALAQRPMPEGLVYKLVRHPPTGVFACCRARSPPPCPATAGRGGARRPAAVGG